MKKEEEKLLVKLKKKEKQEKEVTEKPKGPREPDGPPPSHKQSAASSRDKWDVGVKKNGTNGMLRRKVSIGSRRVGATGLATCSPRRSLRIQKKKKKKLRSPPSAQGLLLETEGRPEAWSNGTRLIRLRQW